MKLLDILDIVLVVLFFIAAIATFFFRVRGNVVGAVSELITLAEKTGLSGAAKMNLVVEKLYDKVPPMLKSVLSHDALQRIAQTIFDWMRKYAEMYAAYANDSENGEGSAEKLESAAMQVTVEAAANLMKEILSLPAEAIAAKAQELGVPIAPGEQTADIAQALMVAVLTKA